MISLSRFVDILDRHFDPIFQKDDDGKTVFYPWGIFGDGFIIESDDFKKKFRKIYIQSAIVFFFSFIGINLAIGAWWGLISIPPYVLLYFLMIRKLTDGFQVSQRKFRYSEVLETLAHSYRMSMLVAIVIASLVFETLAAWSLYNGMANLEIIAGLILFGVGAVLFLVMIIIKLRHKKSQQAQTNSCRN